MHNTEAAIRSVMEQATRWLSVSDIKATVNSNVSTIRKRLRENLAYVSSNIPGDSHGAKQWALATADTSGWANAEPSPKSHRKLKKTKPAPTGNPVCVSQPATYGGLVLMCSPANKPSLIKAVGDLLVNEFVTNGKKFSAHDITNRLREMVLDEAKDSKNQATTPFPAIRPPMLLDHNELGTVGVNGFRVAKIEHEDVKAIVHDIFNAGGMPNLSRRRDSTDQYWEYGPVASLLNVSVTADPQPADATGSTSDPDPISGGTMGSTYDGSSTI